MLLGIYSAVFLITALEGDLKAALDAPAVTAKKKLGWGAAFQLNLTSMSQHEFVGFTNFCIGECMWPLEGAFRIVGFRSSRLGPDVNLRQMISDVTRSKIFMAPISCSRAVFLFSRKQVTLSNGAVV